MYCLRKGNGMPLAWGHTRLLETDWRLITQESQCFSCGSVNISDMLATFGAFMAVLIAIEIFVNITIYLREDVIHVKIVMATALMAIARKVIIMDMDEIEPLYIFSVATVVIAMSIGYWLVHKLSDKEYSEKNMFDGRTLPEYRYDDYEKQ